MNLFSFSKPDRPAVNTGKSSITLDWRRLGNMNYFAFVRSERKAHRPRYELPVGSESSAMCRARFLFRDVR